MQFPSMFSNVELGHHKDDCSLDVIIKNTNLIRKILLYYSWQGSLEEQTSQISLTPQSEGLEAIATGFSINSKDDPISKQFHVYDALHTFCKLQKKQ